MIPNRKGSTCSTVPLGPRSIQSSTLGRIPVRRRHFTRGHQRARLKHRRDSVVLSDGRNVRRRRGSSSPVLLSRGFLSCITLKIARPISVCPDGSTGLDLLKVASSTVVLVAVRAMREVRGQSEEVDWKFYGGANPNEQRNEQSPPRPSLTRRRSPPIQSISTKRRIIWPC
jgi:hypothetical protein